MSAAWRRREQGGVRTAMRFTLAPAIWALHLATVYGLHSFGCARNLFGPGAAGTDRLWYVIVAATVLGVIGIVAGAAATLPSDLPDEEPRFERGVVISLAVLSLFGVLAAGAAGVFVPACVPLR